MSYTEFIRRFINRFRLWLGGVLARLGITPDFLTGIGTISCFMAGISFALGQHRLAAYFIILDGFMDVLDGTVARILNRVTKFGAFYDSTLDRYSDIALFTGIIIYFSRLGSEFYMVLAFIALAGSILTSYARARAENLGIDCRVGFWERPERTFMLVIAGLFNRIPSVMWELAILANITAFHRILHTKKELERPGMELHKSPIIGKLIFWEFPRYCWQYDIYVALAIIVPLIFPLRV